MNICICDISKADIFTGLFQHIKAFTEQVNIMFEKERMYIQTMDSAHVSIIEMDLPCSWFDKYEHKSLSVITLGINSTVLYKVLNAREKTQIIDIHYTNNSDKLLINFTSENKVEFDKHFELPLIDLENELMGIPQIEHQAEFTISSPHFSSIINQLQMFGDTMDIECNEDRIMLNSHSNDNGKMFVEIKIDDLTTFIIDEGGSLNLSFSLKYLHNICLYNKLAREIEIKISDSYPIQVIYDLGGMNGENAKIKFYLAPKMQDD
jgi:proliferating cell nuclear antigen PCNA